MKDGSTYSGSASMLLSLAISQNAYRGKLRRTLMSCFWALVLAALILTVPFLATFIGLAIDPPVAGALIVIAAALMAVSYRVLSATIASSLVLPAMLKFFPVTVRDELFVICRFCPNLEPSDGSGARYTWLAYRVADFDQIVDAFLSNREWSNYKNIVKEYIPHSLTTDDEITVELPLSSQGGTITVSLKPDWSRSTPTNLTIAQNFADLLDQGPYVRPFGAILADSPSDVRGKALRWQMKDIITSLDGQRAIDAYLGALVSEEVLASEELFGMTDKLVSSGIEGYKLLRIRLSSPTPGAVSNVKVEWREPSHTATAKTHQ